MDAAAGIPCVIYGAKSTEDRRGSIPEQLRECREAIDADPLRRIRTLAVVPSHVRQLAQASPGRLVAERAMWSSEVVVGQPAAQRCGALG